MKKLIPMLLLVGMSTNVFAEWTNIGGNDNQGMNAYVDITTIRKHGNLVKIWYLTDYKKNQTFQELKYLSSKSQREYDCKEEQSRGVAFSWFSGNMGDGGVVYSGGTEGRQWEPVQPESVGETLFKVACGIK
ncbi:MAG: surface-adhesin E family protein [Methylococcaceae bacterium]